MNLSQEQLIPLIKTTTIIAVFSDDDLVDLLTLKGGNALALALGLSNSRASFDLDFSLERDFGTFTTEEIRRKLEIRLEEAFYERGFKTFDVTISEKAKKHN